MDKLLSWTLGAAALLAGAGVFYHYVVYLPGVEQAKRAEAVAEVARIEEERQLRAEQYQVCIDAARRGYEKDWAAACRSEADSNIRELKNCLATPSIVNNQFMGKQWCQTQYGHIDPSPDCTLPGKRADGVNAYHTDARKRCETEARIGL